ncbi:MAG TPA: cell surface protein SprA [Gemmatimonadaceae bacterium]|nr:cell surface protein SprA [Gemmatimonadaceae bacterium]
MRISRSLLLFALLVVAGPAVALGQGTPRDTAASTPGLGVRFPPRRDTLALPIPSALLPFGRLAPSRTPAAIVADARAAALSRAIVASQASLWGETVAGALRGAGVPGTGGAAPSDATVVPQLPAAPQIPAPQPRNGTDIFGQHANLGLQLQSRVEVKGERDRNERCVATDFLTPTAGCRGTFQPQFDFQFGVRTGGVVADRVHVNVDYDSQREFDASNNISVYYEGKPDEILHRLELGNVSFVPPPSRFITAGIPSGNYGIQAIGQLGPMNFRAIAAQQKGNVVRDRVFTVGDRTVQTIDRDIEDYQLERRRFFWVLDPKRLSSSYPNIDILDPSLPALAARLPPSERPRRVLVYRYRSPAAGGSTARDINGPFAVTRYARNTNVIGPYEVLQQGIDYYIDPTNLWIVLVSPLSRDERLAVSYTVTGPDGREHAGGIGGTFPQQRGVMGRDTVNLLWDNEVLPGDSAFDREIRSAYRLGGEDLQRQSVALKVVVGSGADQEKPVGGSLDTYLQLFGLAQRSNSSTFDVENRLWPRVGDPNDALTTSGGLGGTSSKLIRDYFVIFPSLMPFSDSGLVRPPNPANDSLYRTTDEDLISQRRPPTQYRIRVRYSSAGGEESGSLMLGSVQLRPGSERLFLDGRQLQRDVDYTVDYEIGRVTFNRPDTLFARPRQVSVQYEENPLFAAAPTSILGLAAEFPSEHGLFSITALSQSQRTSFNRPPLGFEPQSALLAGVNGNFTWQSTLLTRLIDKLPLVDATTPSTVNVQGEFATSRPQHNSAGAAYVETFEGEGGVPVSLQETAWRIGSQPAIQGSGLTLGGVGYDFSLDSATTLAWQNLGTVQDPITRTGTAVQFFPEQIDSQFVFIGGQTFRAPETVLWLDLYPPNVGGLRDPSGRARWLLPPGGGRPWRSISQSLDPNGVDLSHVEQLEFWALIDTSEVARRKNPVLVFDFGEVSENSIAFGPETLTVRQPVPSGGGDTVYTGRRLVGFDRLDTERDPVTQSFDVARNDNGIPGDVVDSIVVRNTLNGRVEQAARFPVCRRGDEPVLPLGDANADCTVGNRRLDEEDLDRDGFLNLHGAGARNSEQLLRYVVNLGDAGSYTKTGRCYRDMTDTSATAPGPRTFCWVKFQRPFGAPDARINDPLVRRIRSVRLTMVGGDGRAAGDFSRIAIARLRFVGAPWTKRTESAIAGIGGTRIDAPGTVIATTVGTQDRDARLQYESPPGVTDEPDSKGSVYSPGTIQVNEKSLRLLAVNLPLYHRAEAYYRFPEGEKNFMGYRELRVWARGRDKGWGTNGDLEFYIKIGRDADNFYLFRTPVNQGPGRDAWLPEVSVDFRRFYELRARVENAYLHGGEAVACHGLDSALIANSELPTAPGTRRFAACDGGYMVYTSNPAVSPPNLAAVQEMAVGILRVSEEGKGSGGSIAPTDSLELWVDDIRLTSVVNDPGYAGQIGVNVVAGDLGTFQVSASRRDQNFRQLGEQPTFMADDQLALSSSVRLDKFLPRSVGLVLPLTVTHTRTGGTPLFLSSSDVTADAVGDVRAPSNSATSWALTARRATPMEHGALAPIVNNLSLTTTYVTANSRSEFQTGRTSAFSSALDYDLVSQARTTRTPGFVRKLIDHLPGWLKNSELLRSMHDATMRWNPTLVRLTSTYARNSDTRESFALPVVLGTDTARVVRGLDDVWRNTGAIELRPFNTLSARWDISSLRDLRDYGDSTGVGVVAGGERERFLGMDVGLERERQMSAVVSAVLPLTAWVKPRVDFTTNFSVLRDPNTPNLLRADGDTAGEFRLPRRLSNGQGLAVTATFDIPRAIGMYASDSSALRPLAKVLSPIDVQWRRDLRSTFDGVPFDPSLGYQLALGGVGSFREVDGIPATSAGVSRSLVLSHSLYLPLGMTLLNRYSRVRSTSWSRILQIQTLLQAEQETFPDLSLRWSYNLPPALRDIVSSVGAQVGARVTKSKSFQPTAGDQTFIPGLGLRIEQTLRQYPLNGSLTWGLLGGFSTSAGWNHTTRRDVRSGGLTVGDQNDVNVDVGKSFGLPRSWSLKSNQLRTRIGYQTTHTQAFFVQDSTRKRVTDNGRWAITGNADSDVSDTMSLTLLLARVLTYDNALDRRFSQTVVSVVFHLQFFAGELR